MPWLVDGSNVLGAMRLDRHDDAAKRDLVRRLGALARASRSRVTCVFDGPEPAGFARNLGPVSVVFSGASSADDLIVRRAAEGNGWRVVTSDRGLASRVRRREVEIVAAATLIARLMEEGSGPAGGGGEDWDAWFSDPSNRMKF